jgi:hypothetical protein
MTIPTQLVLRALLALVGFLGGPLASLSLPAEHRWRYRQELLAELYGTTRPSNSITPPDPVRCLDPPGRAHRAGPADVQGGRYGQALALSNWTAPLAAPAQPRRRLVWRMPPLRNPARRRHWGEHLPRQAGNRRPLLIGRCRQRQYKRSARQSSSRRAGLGRRWRSDCRGRRVPDLRARRRLETRRHDGAPSSARCGPDVSRGPLGDHVWCFSCCWFWHGGQWA